MSFLRKLFGTTSKMNPADATKTVQEYISSNPVGT